MDMDFGRHRGQAASELPLSYLLWAARTMDDPPACVTEELARRASIGGRGAVDAQEAISQLWLRRAKRKRKRGRGAPASVVITGGKYAEARAEWLRAGGDPRSCPWD